MSDYIFYFLVVLILIAAFLREDFVLTLLYVFLGSLILGRWWGKRTIKEVDLQRKFTRRAFLGEKVKVQLEITNTGWLPLIWLQVRESLPVELFSGGPFQQLLTLRPKKKFSFDYSLDCRKRGYYSIGPSQLFSGDLLGLLATQSRSIFADSLTVFPKIIPITNQIIPSNAPIGTLRHKQRLIEDPNRIMGKRDYVMGDSIRRIDWKSTATVGRLQVKNYEPSIALETSIFLNLNAADYIHRTRIDTAELAIVVAASLSNWIISNRQAVGLVTNGTDPMLNSVIPLALPPRNGRIYLLKILETLARIQVAETKSLLELLQTEIKSLSWGTTLILISNNINDDHFSALFQAQRAGLRVQLILCGVVVGFMEIKNKANQFGIPVLHVREELELEKWQLRN